MSRTARYSTFSSSQSLFNSHPPLARQHGGNRLFSSLSQNQGKATQTPSNTPNGAPTPSTNGPTSSQPQTPASETIRRAFELDRRDAVHTREKGEFDALAGEQLKKRNDNWLYYLGAIVFASLGVSFVSVPLYQVFCQVTGVGGTVQRDQQMNELNRYMQRTRDVDDVALRPIQVIFESTVHPALDWEFEPCQKDITLRIGETALAFFRAKNNSDKPVIGVSTYNVIPPQAGIYFNKIQCFCFDEQRLRSGEEIDMPIFFFLDPAMANDWRLDNIDQVTLCYTFFEVEEDKESNPLLDNAVLMDKDAMKLPIQDDVPPVPAPAAPAVSPATLSNGFVPRRQRGIPHTEQIVNKARKQSSSQEICPIIPPTAMHNPTGKSLYATSNMPPEDQQSAQ